MSCVGSFLILGVEVERLCTAVVHIDWAGVVLLVSLWAWLDLARTGRSHHEGFALSLDKGED